VSKKRLVKRLSWYYPVERFNVFLFTGILVWLILQFSFRDIIWLIYGLLIMIIILFQGQFYWKLKLDRIKGKVINQRAALLFFRVSKKLNYFLITLIPVVLMYQLYLNDWAVVKEGFMVWALLANLFGVLEHINYYHYQLMYDNVNDINYLKINKRLKTASLKKDILESNI
jgi:hypothetical protein